jgi:hypothetical protein
LYLFWWRTWIRKIRCHIRASCIPTIKCTSEEVDAALDLPPCTIISLRDELDPCSNKFSAHDLWHSHRFPVLVCFQFLVLPDEWSGDFWAHRVVDTLGKMNTKKTQVNCIKSGPIIRHFSDLGLFRIRVSTLYIGQKVMAGDS